MCPMSINRFFFFFLSFVDFFFFIKIDLGIFMRPDDANMYSTLEPTMSTNPNVYFQRGGEVHPGMMY